MQNRIRFFRVIAICEGISFLTLILVAMPLKYFANLPEAVKIIGWMHGLLFILYIPTVLLIRKQMRWNFVQVMAALIAAVVPFAPFIIDKKLVRKM